MVGLENPEEKTRNIKNYDKENIKYIFNQLRQIENQTGTIAQTEITGKALETPNYQSIDIQLNTQGKTQEFLKELNQLLEQDDKIHKLTHQKTDNTLYNANFTLNRYKADGIFRKTKFNITLQNPQETKPAYITQ